MGSAIAPPSGLDTKYTGVANSPPDQQAIPAELRAGIRILIVDDDRTLREGCASVLQMEGYTVITLGRGDEALEMLEKRPFDIVLVDLYMSMISGMQLLEAAVAKNRHTHVIVMTGNPSVTSSVEAKRLGAWDYMTKPFSATHLQVLVGRAAHAILDMREAHVREQRQLQAESTPAGLLTLIGKAPAFRQALELARRVAKTDASVMITGESGTGKEGFAQFIHEHSNRSAKTLVPINCAAMPEPLLESEMFGHRRGAFTGADRDKPGLLEMANGGTFFLDELTEMPHAIQAKLLRVLQDGVVRRVGSEQSDTTVDVRFISATNVDPNEAVRGGRLREDLLYRLRVVPIRLPALRERVEDIPLLARHFMARYWARHRRSDGPMPDFAGETIDYLCSRPWRGNVRELQNVIEHVAVLADAGRPLLPADIPLAEDVLGPTAKTSEGIPATLLDEAFHPAKDRLIALFEKEYLARLVVRAGGNMSKAARLAGVDRTTLYRLMEKHSLHRDDMAAASFR